jgi:hypothetical protein
MVKKDGKRIKNHRTKYQGLLNSVEFDRIKVGVGLVTFCSSLKMRTVAAIHQI